MAKKNGTRAMTPMIRESAHSIWLAGLGALAMAGEEGGKLFKQLVKRGESVDKLNKNRLGQLKARAMDLRADANAAMGRFSGPMDLGLGKALHKLGVPTRHEILSLARRVEDLTRAVSKKKVRRAPRPKKHAAPAAV